jgi:hypothetical protein
MPSRLKLKISSNENPPKKEPIVVTNPNDPRLIAYKDSLTLRNTLNKFKGQKPEDRSAADLKKMQEAYFRLKKYNKGTLEPKKFVKDGNVRIFEEYYEPVQPYILKSKEGIEPVIFKAKSKEKIGIMEPTAKKITEKIETPKMQPSAVKGSDLIYRVEYWDPKTGKSASKFFPNEKQGSEFQKSLSSEQNKYGSTGRYVKNSNK